MRWKTLQHRSGLRGVVDSINHEARMKYFNMSFGELCDKFVSSASLNYPDLLKTYNSIKFFWNWCRVQNIPPDQLFREIAAIMDSHIENEHVDRDWSIQCRQNSCDNKPTRDARSFYGQHF